MRQFVSHTTLIADTIRRLRQVPGTQTQLYSETVIDSYLREAFYVLKTEAWWPWLMTRLSGTLDGTTGKVVGSPTPWTLGGVRDFDDIRAVYLNNWQNRITKIGEDFNPAGTSYGTMATFVEPLAHQADPTGAWMFNIWPKTTTGTVYIWARSETSSLFIVPSEIVPMNRFMLMNYAMWRYMTDDAANPGAAAAALQAYEKIKEQELEKVNSLPILLDSGNWNVSDQWQER